MESVARSCLSSDELYKIHTHKISRSDRFMQSLLPSPRVNLVIDNQINGQLGTYALSLFIRRTIRCPLVSTCPPRKALATVYKKKSSQNHGDHCWKESYMPRLMSDSGKAFFFSHILTFFYLLPSIENAPRFPASLKIESDSRFLCLI